MSSIMKRLTPKWAFVFIIVGSTVFVIYVYFSIGLNEFVSVAQNLNLSSFLFYISLGLVAMLFTLLSWATSWLTLLRAISVKMSIRKTLLYYLAGDFIDRLVPSPGVAGDVTRAFLVRDETQPTYGAVAAALITNRIVTYGVVLSGLSVGIGYLLLTNSVPVFASGLLVTVWLGALASFIVLAVVSLKQNAVETLTSLLMKLLKAFRYRKVDQLSTRAFKFLSRFHEGFVFYGTNKRFLVLPIIFNSLSFALNFVVYIFVFYSLGLTQLPVEFYIAVYLLSGAIQDAAAALSVGSLEIFLINFFVLYGVSPATSGVAALLLRGLTFYFPLIVGYATMQVIGAQNLLKQRTTEQAEKDESEIWTELPQTPMR